MDFTRKNIGFIGFGNMGRAIAEGWLRTKRVNPDNLFASARDIDKLNEKTKKLGIRAVNSNEELVEAVDIIILAVKPYQIRNILEPMKERLADKVIVSLAVDVLFEDFREYLLPGTEHLSTLPNTPMAIGEGIILFEETNSLTDEHFEMVTDLFKQISHVEIIPSAQMGIAGLISGSAPAFVDIFTEALADAAVKHGLDRKTAYRLISQMISGTAELQLETGKHPGELKDEITSPGGTTIKGIASLEKNHFRGTVIDAVDAILEDK